MNVQTRRLLLLCTTLVLAACGRAPQQPPSDAVASTPTPTNRVDINANVRENLGITFATVEARNVAQTLRVPGRFELTPSARREYRLPVAGSVEVLVDQYQRVEPGTPLFRVDAPRWRELQRELTDAYADSALARAAIDSIAPFLDAHEKHHTEIAVAVDVWTKRVGTLEQLRAAGGASADEISQAKAALASSRAAFAETLEKEAELAVRQREAQAQLAAAQARYSILLQSAAALTHHNPEDLLVPSDDRPAWQSIQSLEIVAKDPGVIDEIHTVSGAYLDPSALILSTIQPERIRFRAHALQSDLTRLAEGLPASVVPPHGGPIPHDETIPGSLSLAPAADPERRTIEVLMTHSPDARLPLWAKPGVSAFLEIVLRADARPQLAVPLACVAKDGAQPIIFRRDPADPNKAIRLNADLGLDDGRWIVIKSGVAEGDQVILHGVYQLMIATSDNATKGGHFHPDGTFHEGDE